MRGRVEWRATAFCGSERVEALLRFGRRARCSALLIAAHQRCRENGVEIVVIKTSGDMIQDRALSQAGGKGLFTKEIDAALLEGGIDLAVHSAKDMPTRLPRRDRDRRLSAARGRARRADQRAGEYARGPAAGRRRGHRQSCAARR